MPCRDGAEAGYEVPGTRLLPRVAAPGFPVRCHAARRSPVRLPQCVMVPAVSVDIPSRFSRMLIGLLCMTVSEQGIDPVRRMFPRTTFSAVFLPHFWSTPIVHESAYSTTSRQKWYLHILVYIIFVYRLPILVIHYRGWSHPALRMRWSNGPGGGRMVVPVPVQPHGPQTMPAHPLRSIGSRRTGALPRRSCSFSGHVQRPGFRTHAEIALSCPRSPCRLPPRANLRHRH